MKERKLFLWCLSFLVISFLGIQLCGKYFLEEWKLSNAEKNIPPGSRIEIAGYLYRKEEASDYQILYLKNVSITYQNQSIKESQIIVYNKEIKKNPMIGNKVICSGEAEFFEAASNPGNFDRKWYYQKKKIHAYLWTEQVDIEPWRKCIFKNTLLEMRTSWSMFLKEMAGEKYGGILSAMLLGDKTEMDEETKELYQLNGIAHILAISGLHLSFVGHGFYQLVRKSSGSYLIGGLIGLTFMTVYIMMIGVSISALRAVVMFVLRVAADMSGRIYDRWTAVSLAAVVVILWRPLSFYDGGFQLSFGAIVGVQFLKSILVDKKKDKRFLKDFIISNVSIQILTFPILLYHYFEFPLYSVWLNIIVVPLMSLVLLLAAASVLAGSIWSGGGALIVNGCVWILEGYEYLCDRILDLPYARIVTGRPKMWGIAAYYLCVVVVIGILCLRKGNSRKRAGLLVLFVPGVIVLLASCPFVMKKEFETTMLDVGQGDCIYIEQGEFSCLVDGGSSTVNRVAKYRMEPFLKYKGVSELDYVFVTHGDWDHISGIQEMLERQREGVQIKNLVLPDKSVWDESLWALARLASSKGVKILVIHAGDVLQNGLLQIECLYPDGQLDGVAIGNGTSLVLAVSYENFDMLLTGDIEKEGEKQLLNLLSKGYDVLKVAHHGSKNSTSDELLETTGVKIGLISAGENNLYGHPHAETLQRLAERNCRVWNTADCGAVSVKLEEEGLVMVSDWGRGN